MRAKRHSLSKGNNWGWFSLRDGAAALSLLLTTMKKYDYIIAGTGAAGLSLAYFILHRERLSDKNVLLIDRDDKKQNDRTWTFWGNPPAEFKQLVTHTWQKMQLKEHDRNVVFSTRNTPYHYIPGIKFYDFIIPKLKKAPNISFLKGNIEQISELGEMVQVTVESIHYSADFVFNSAYPGTSSLTQIKEEIAFQRFKGWEVIFEKDVLDAEKVTLMDFSVPQNGDVKFIYILPLSSRKMIINCTAFGVKEMEEKYPEECMDNFIQKTYPAVSYEIVRKEQGKIPMSHRIPNRNYSNRIMNIGTLGGDTRPSTGYTFINTINHSGIIADSLAQRNKLPNIKPSRRHYSFYDKIFLRVLKNDPQAMRKALISLFQKNEPDKVFRFLSAETKVTEEMPLILSLPILPFLKGFIDELKNKNHG